MVTRLVDLRSDTVTKPNEAMRAAMANAEVDDAVLGDDPTAFRLEFQMAQIMGKEAALFLPSGTMGNLISVLTYCDIRGSEVILGDNSHIHIYENGGMHARTVKNNKDGTMNVNLIEAAIRDPAGTLVYPTTRLICLENSQANCGGRCLSVEYTDGVGELAKKHGLRLHIDGVYDVTIGYKPRCPSLLDNVFGVDPSEVHIHVRRIMLDDIPISEEELSGWLMDTFQLKDQLLSNFYSHGHFPNEGTEGDLSTAKCLVNFSAVILLIGILTYLTIFSSVWFKIYVSLVCCYLSAATYLSVRPMPLLSFLRDLFRF